MARELQDPPMRRCRSLALIASCLALTGCDLTQGLNHPSSGLNAPLQIEIDPKQPSNSFGTLLNGKGRTVFKVGFGRQGITCAGTRFEEGYTPLGKFRVNAILSNERFEMEPALITLSGKSEDELAKTLFRNMNSIDFNGDGETDEYGNGYISLAAINSVKQPFEFNQYDGKFRWYSFAIHGSNDDKRIGQMSTGGCLNVARPDLKALLSVVKLGDEVIVSANGPCTP